MGSDGPASVVLDGQATRPFLTQPGKRTIPDRVMNGALTSVFRLLPLISSRGGPGSWTGGESPTTRRGPLARPLLLGSGPLGPVPWVGESVSVGSREGDDNSLTSVIRVRTDPLLVDTSVPTGFALRDGVAGQTPRKAAH